MRNEKLVLAVLFLMILGLSTQLTAQTKSTVFGTSHDISSLGGGCKVCHAPHQASAKGETLQWAQNFPTTATFGVYSTPTMQVTPTDVGGNYSATNRPSGAKMYSVLCLSCHDGLTTPSVINSSAGSAIANPTSSDGLKNDHPVNMAYNDTLDAGLLPLATVQASFLKLYADGTTQTVQCASCHNVHDNTIAHFLRVADNNTKAGLCTGCHK